MRLATGVCAMMSSRCSVLGIGTRPSSRGCIEIISRLSQRDTSVHPLEDVGGVGQTAYLRNKLIYTPYPPYTEHIIYCTMALVSIKIHSIIRRQRSSVVELVELYCVGVSFKVISADDIFRQTSTTSLLSSDFSLPTLPHHNSHTPPNMSTLVNITSKEQFSSILSSSTIVVVDCKSAYPLPTTPPHQHNTAQPGSTPAN